MHTYTGYKLINQDSKIIFVVIKWQGRKVIKCIIFVTSMLYISHVYILNLYTNMSQLSKTQTLTYTTNWLLI